MALPKLLLSTALALAAASFVGAGCNKTETDPGPKAKDCADQGGVLVDVDGTEVCEAKCDASKCFEGNTCVGNRCKLVCTKHSDCFSQLEGDEINQGCVAVTEDSATGLNDGASIHVCDAVLSHPLVGLPCPLGHECDTQPTACPDGTPCDYGGCDPAHCKPLVCRTDGLNDAEAYCTTVDCATEADCAPGYYCGVIRAGEIVPGATCTTAKGDDDFQVPCDQIEATNASIGGTLKEGPVSLVRNACIKREPCAPCASSVDCSLRADMQCVQVGSTFHCAETCLIDADCADDFACAGAAAPQVGFCVPRVGTCVPPATNNFCYPCLNDLDCGPAGPGNTQACADLALGQRGCFDASFSTSCTVDSQCPLSPSGRNGECLDEAEGVAPTDSVYHTCYVPFISQQFQCWPLTEP